MNVDFDPRSKKFRPRRMSTKEGHLFAIHDTGASEAYHFCPEHCNLWLKASKSSTMKTVRIANGADQNR